MDDQFAPEINTAILNSEWEALTSAQRQCLTSMVEAAREDGSVWRMDVDFSARIAGSKALKPYILFEDPDWRITPEARVLVAHAKATFKFPAWRYLRHWDAQRGEVMSIIQTQDAAFADQLLTQPGWSEIDVYYFRRMAQFLQRAMMGHRQVTTKVEY
jgi:hypothetical protein